MSRLAATLFAACTALSAGCAENQETLIVLFAPAWEEGDCSANPNADATLGRGLLDIAYDTPYTMPALLLNNSATQATNDNGTGVISNEIQLKDAEVTIDSPQAPDVIAAIDDDLLDFTASLQTLSLPPQQETGVVVEVLPLATVRALREQLQAQLPGVTQLEVRANVVFNGTRTGNDVGKVGKVKARDFSFPIDLCLNCLLTCRGCEMAQCPVDFTELGGGICGNAQDFPLYPSACDPPE